MWATLVGDAASPHPVGGQAQRVGVDPGDLGGRCPPAARKGGVVGREPGFGDRHQGRHGHGDGLVATLDDAAGDDLPVVAEIEVLTSRDLGPIQAFRDLGTDLPGLAVDGRQTAEDEIERADTLNRSGQDVGGGPGVGSGERPIGHQVGGVGAVGERVAQSRLGGGRPHRDGDDLIGQLERRLQSVQIGRIDDRRGRAAVDGAVRTHRHGPGAQVGDLFDQHCGAHRCRSSHAPVGSGAVGGVRNPDAPDLSRSPRWSRPASRRARCTRRRSDRAR